MAITLRLVKGSELTFAEVDDNFKSLFYSASLDGNELKLFYYPGTSFESVDLSSISIATASFATTAQTASYVDLVAGSNVTINQVGTSFEISSSGGGGGAAFPYTGSAEITGSLSVTGSTTLSGSGNQILTVEGSGSSNPIFTVNGSLGELFTVTDSLSGSLLSVNNISGLSILDVQSDNRILMGNPTYPSLNTTVRFSATASGNIIYEIPTSSYEGAFFEYTVQSASNARAGSIMTTWIPGTSDIVSTETTTTDIGSTSGVSFTTIITGSNIALTASVGDDTWIVKTIIRSI